MEKLLALLKDASVKLSNIYLLMAHMTSNVYANIHLNNTIEIVKNVKNKNVLIAIHLIAHGLALVDKDMISMLQFHKHYNNVKNKANQ